jgi:hypothetical protein
MRRGRRRQQQLGEEAGGILVDGSRRLLEAEAAAGVKHHVCVSIVGCDQVLRLRRVQDQRRSAISGRG